MQERYNSLWRLLGLPLMTSPQTGWQTLKDVNAKLAFTQKL